MGTAENKEVVRKIYEGGPDDIVAGMSDAVKVTLIGNTKMSGTMNGKKEVLAKCGPYLQRLENFGKNVIDNMIAEGDYVALQMHGVGRKTKSGRDYNNTYCIVCKVRDGKVTEITEYCDTELLTSAILRD